MNALTILSQSLRPAAELEAELEAELRAARTEHERRAAADRTVRVSILPDGTRQIVLIPGNYTESFQHLREPRKLLRGRALKRWMRSSFVELPPYTYTESDDALYYGSIREALEDIGM